MSAIKTTIFLLTALILTLCVLGACSLTKGSPEAIRGRVTETDKYGHAILDITIEEFNAAGYKPGDVINVSFEGFSENMPYFTGFYVDPLEMMLRGMESKKYLAVCINYGNFAETTEITVGDEVTLSLHERAGAMNVQTLNSLEMIYDPTLYEDEETFANFRAVTLGNIGQGKLYRSSSPVDNRNGRAAIVDGLLKEKGISTILNLSDDKKNVESFFEKEDFASPNYEKLYAEGRVITMDLNFDIYSEGFAREIAHSLKLLAEQSPPYLIHCTEGRDRTGFAAIILEALMGATLEEIRDDYMKSYYSIYGITRESDPKKYESILRINFHELMRVLTGTYDYENLDLVKASEHFLKNAEMDEEVLKELKAKLGK